MLTNLTDKKVFKFNVPRQCMTNLEALLKMQEMQFEMEIEDMDPDIEKDTEVLDLAGVLT